MGIGKIDNYKFFEGFEEIKEVYDLICSWLTEARKNKCAEIFVTVF